MSRRVCVIDVPGLSRELLGAVPQSSLLGQWLKAQRVASLVPSWPAVTCSVQATLTTGVSPARHGIVANGIATFRSPQDQRLIDASNFADYRRDVSFWEQSNQLVESPRFWQDPSKGRSKWTTALLFFQNSMPGFVEPFRPAADIVITPKPEHGPDGKLLSLCWSEPRELMPRLVSTLGPFPLMKYWGPMAGIESSQWIAHAAAIVWTELSPQLQFVYVPHLDYDLQRLGPRSPQATKAVHDVAAAIQPLLDVVLRDPNDRVVLLSEYAMTEVSRVVQPNRLLAEAGLLITRNSPDGALVDYARSAAFAMVDHQIAHVYVRDTAAMDRVAALMTGGDSVEVLEREQVLPHRRSGDLVVQTAADAWLDYRWWTSAADAPAFATAVDIHRKPGYDPLELFFDPVLRGVAQDPSRLRGSHGHVAGADPAATGIVVGSLETGDQLRAEAFAGLVARMLDG